MHERKSIQIDDIHAFDLNRVTWGYRHTYAYALEGLKRDRVIGETAPRVTAALIAFLNQASDLHFEDGARDLLVALHERDRGLLRLPDLFEQLCATSRQMGEVHRNIAARFLRYWSEGRFGDQPEHLAHLLQLLRQVLGMGADVTAALMDGYPELIRRLTPQQLDRFVEALGPMHRRRPQTACDFAAVRLEAADRMIDELTEEIRLDDIRPRLERLVRAVSGRSVEVHSLSELDSDMRLDRRPTVVCLTDRLYLPRRMVRLGDGRANASAYQTFALVAAASLRCNSFSIRHGGPHGPLSLPDWCDRDPVWAAATWLIEIQRTVTALRRWRGAARLVDDAIEREFQNRPVESRTDAVLHDLLTDAVAPMPLISAVRAAADAACDVQDARRLARGLIGQVEAHCDGPLRVMHWFPDFGFPAESDVAQAAPPLVRRNMDKAGQLREQERTSGDAGSRTTDDVPAHADGAAVFVYPEWSRASNGYLKDWCYVREVWPESQADDQPIVSDARTLARVRRMFERLKPQLVHKEKRLLDGDQINHDHLIDYLCERRSSRSASPRFYEKPLTRRRDLAVALLLDISGSTGLLSDGRTCPPARPDHGQRVIGLEKAAASVLAEGMDILGDSFAVYGFSGHGREHCQFHIFKDFNEDPSLCRRRLAKARPLSNTRIGPALRHTHAKLADQPARKRIVLLITDGQPQDAQYDTASGHAQADVRAACLEALRDDIKVVCISAADHDPHDLNVMFPGRRFVTLRNMGDLVNRLPQLYLRMTH
mgnify:FL=1